jgi:hypothetical protein
MNIACNYFQSPTDHQSRAHEINTNQILVVIQNHFVVSTFPGSHDDAAINLARVLCRSLEQPVDIFRLRRIEALGIHCGLAVKPQYPAWTPVAQVRKSDATAVLVERAE